MADEPTVSRREIEPGVHLLELNRPERLNAISDGLLADLHDELRALAEDRSARVVVLTGRGRGFCAGLDLQEWGQAAPGGPVNRPAPVRSATSRPSPP